MGSRDELLTELGLEIRARRLSAALTQDELGRGAGIVGKYVSEIERGTRDVPISTLHAIVERGLGLRLAIEFRGAGSARPVPRPSALPKPIEDLAVAVAELSQDERTHVLAIIRGLAAYVAR